MSVTKSRGDQNTASAKPKSNARRLMPFVVAHRRDVVLAPPVDAEQVADGDHRPFHGISFPAKSPITSFLVWLFPSRVWIHFLSG